MEPHRQWLIDNGLGNWTEKVDSREGCEFLDDCKYDDNDETCNSCSHKKECDKYFKPLADALERCFEIGEI